MDVTGILLATIIIILAIAYYVHHHFGKTRKMLYYAAKLDGPRGLPLIGSAFYLLGSNTTVAKNIIYLAKKIQIALEIVAGDGTLRGRNSTRRRRNRPESSPVQSTQL
jgi:hypothetical protein